MMGKYLQKYYCLKVQINTVTCFKRNTWGKSKVNSIFKPLPDLNNYVWYKNGVKRWHYVTLGCQLLYFGFREIMVPQFCNFLLLCICFNTYYNIFWYLISDIIYFRIFVWNALNFRWRASIWCGWRRGSGGGSGQQPRVPAVGAVCRCGH